MYKGTLFYKGLLVHEVTFFHEDPYALHQFCTNKKTLKMYER